MTKQINYNEEIERLKKENQRLKLSIEIQDEIIRILKTRIELKDELITKFTKLTK